MKVKIERPVGMSEEEAEEKLHKALDAKKKAKELVGEQYTDSMVNDFHDQVSESHKKVLEEIDKNVKERIKRSLGV